MSEKRQKSSDHGENLSIGVASFLLNRLLSSFYFLSCARRIFFFFFTAGTGLIPQEKTCLSLKCVLT